MDTSTRKLYHVHGIDSREFLETYFSGRAKDVFGEDVLKFPMERIYNMICSAAIKGEILIDISMAPLVHHLYSVCGLFKDIILLRFTERCIMELTKWLGSRTGAFDWSHISSIMADPQTSCDEWEEKEMQLKSAIKQIVKCDITNNNLIDPVVVPKADCVITAWILDVISANEEDYMMNLRKIVYFVKPGGFLLLIGAINGTYYTVGQDRMHLFPHDENFVKNALVKEGFTVIHCEVLERTIMSDLTDYKGMSFVTARKNE